MMLIPLPERKFQGKEHFPIDLFLDQNKDYEMAIYNIQTPDIVPYGLYTIYCDLLDPTVANPSQSLYRFTDQMIYCNLEFYKMDTYSLRNLSLTLEGLETTSLTITIAIKECHERCKENGKFHSFYPLHATG